MGWIEITLIIFLVLVSLALTALILLQQGRGADVGAAFGSGAGSAMFGAPGALSIITKATTWLSAAFFVICFVLAYVAKERASDIQSVVGDLPIVEETAPTVPSDLPPASPLPASSPELPAVAPAGGEQAPSP